MAQRGHRAHRRVPARPRRLPRNQDLGHDGPVHRRVRSAHHVRPLVDEHGGPDSHSVGRGRLDAHRSRDQSGV